MSPTKMDILLLDEAHSASLPVDKRTCFVLNWLLQLDQLLEELEPVCFLICFFNLFF